MSIKSFDIAKPGNLRLIQKYLPECSIGGINLGNTTKIVIVLQLGILPCTPNW